MNGSLTPDQCESAGELVGRFHRIAGGLSYRFRHRMPHFHATAEKIRRMRRTRTRFVCETAFRPLVPLADEITAAYAAVRGTLRGLPDRIIHGDLKVNNIRFDRTGRRAVSLLDLDTLGRHVVAVDIGDAARSWCNGAREGDWRSSRFLLGNFERMLRGYLRGAGTFITEREFRSFLAGAETIILELASRFVTDAYRQEYFKLEQTRYRNLFEQNLARARSQMALYRDLASKHQQAEAVMERLWLDHKTNSPPNLAK